MLLKTNFLLQLHMSNYYVEAIVNHKGIIGDRKYLVKWEGYSSSENAWEPASHIFNDQLIKNYWNFHDKEKKANAKNLNNTKQLKSGNLKQPGKT